MSSSATYSRTPSAYVSPAIGDSKFHTHTKQQAKLYRVSIKSFPDYKHLLQENYVEYKHIFFTIT